MSRNWLRLTPTSARRYAPSGIDLLLTCAASLCSRVKREVGAPKGPRRGKLVALPSDLCLDLKAPATRHLALFSARVVEHEQLPGAVRVGTIENREPRVRARTWCRQGEGVGVATDDVGGLEPAG